FSEQDEASKPDHLQYSYVVVGAGGAAIARAVTTYGTCPLITIGNANVRMQLRAGSGTMPQRPTASAPAESKPSYFPVITCEATLPADAGSASIGGQPLPLPKAEPQRIVILGDTGCRMKKADNAFQDCNSIDQWPLSRIAATAASLKPDLVLHVGDYHYRETACPEGVAGCKYSPWGYGWDAWEADLFKPAAPLLAAAPWVAVRGNHEECARAGQGWFRFLAPEPYTPTRSCNDARNDAAADLSPPYAVPLGGDNQFIVFDSAKAGFARLPTDDPKSLAYQFQLMSVARLAGGVRGGSFFASHHPVLGYAMLDDGKLVGGNLALQGAMAQVNGVAYYPAGIQLALHGHVHSFQALSFASDHPATLISGNGGDDISPALPSPLPPLAPAPGVTLERITHSTTFGFILMERAGAGWTYKAYTAGGKVMTTCSQQGRRLLCDRTGRIAA
ncbi:MAG: metallophosphoesterase family protein, partial [Burkholderiaceae bacterium]